MCEEDVDDDGDLIRRWVMRPDADRRQMEAYVRTTVAERCTARGITPLHPDIVTLSVRCAEEGGGAETGIPALLSQFSGVLDRAADFKRQAPRAALQKLVNQVRTGKDGSGLTQLLTQLKEVRGSCNETRTRLRACREAAQGAIVGTIVWEVERAFGSETDIARLNTRLPEICEQISTRLIAEHLVEPLNRIFIEWDRSVLSLSATAQASPMLQIEDIYETVTVHNKATGRAVGSGLGGLASLALPYVVVLTGPVGIAIGVAAAMAAATAGGMAGAAMAGTTTHKFKVGTNIEKVKTGVITYLQHVTAERVMRACDALDTSLLGAIDLRLTAMDAAFARFETTLTQEVLA